MHTAKQSNALLVGVVLAIVLSLFAIFRGPPSAVGPATRDETLERIRATRELRAGYIVFPPTVQLDPSTKVPTGHFIDTIRFISDQLDVQLSLEETTWATFVSDLQTSKYDIIVAGTYVTPKRAKEVLFTRPLFYLGTSAVIARDKPDLHDMAAMNRPDITIAVTTGGTPEEFAKASCPKANISSFASTDLTLPLLEVVNGRADVAFQDTYTVRAFLDKNPHSNVVGLFLDSPVNVTAVAWTVRQGDLEWANFLNNSLEYMDSAGLLEQFERKYGATWLHRSFGWSTSPE
jgi:polar amino acid transport system substrate-binding protein